MELQKTTLRIKAPLLEAAKRRALDEGATFQDVVNSALWFYLKRTAEVAETWEVLRLQAKNLGVSTSLTREDIYE